MSGQSQNTLLKEIFRKNSNKDFQIVKNHLVIADVNCIVFEGDNIMQLLLTRKRFFQLT